MYDFFLMSGGLTALFMLALYWLMRRHWGRRIRILEQDLLAFSQAMCQMAEIQMKVKSKTSANLSDIEERIMDLAVPSDNSGHPLERRHRVIALARQNVTLDEIVKRLDIPRGEAELILNLRNYKNIGATPAAKANEEMRTI